MHPPACVCGVVGRRAATQDAAALVDALRKNTHLTELYASNHPLEPRTVELFAALLCGSQALQALCIGNEGLGDAGCERLAPGVAGSTCLARLDMSHKVGVIVM